MLYSIENKILSVKIDSIGAEICSVKSNGHERSWQNETGEWSGHAPILFPVCGNCAVIVDGKKYDMPKHGFASKLEFECVRCDEKSATFKLCANSNTVKIYPFDFVLFIEYALDGNSIVITYTIENIGDKLLWFSLGGHDSFALDKNIGEYKLIFDKSEKFDALIHDDDGLLTGEKKSMGEGNELRLPESFLQNGQTLILSRLNSKTVTLCEMSGERIAELSTVGFENLLLWRPGNAKMICIEPWMNLPDDGVTINTEFYDKSGIREVAAHSSIKISRSVTYY